MATYGLNNFTHWSQPSGTGQGIGSYASDMVNSTETSKKINEFKETIGGLNQLMNTVKQFQRGSGFERLQMIAKAIMGGMS